VVGGAVSEREGVSMAARGQEREGRKEGKGLGGRQLKCVGCDEDRVQPQHIADIQKCE
jgi:hypothetical protein